MKQETIIEILKNHTNLLIEANKVGINITETVVNNLIKQINLRTDTFSYYDEYYKCTKEFPVPTDYEMIIGKTKGKIPIIKEYRDRTHLSLMEAKQSIENYFKLYGYSFFQQG
jgi:ribosomal protein L7/L12